MSVSVLLPERRRAWHDRLAAALGTLDSHVVIDLSEGGTAAPAGRVLRPLYDGSPDAAALLGRLQRRECPYLEVIDETGATLAASYAAIEDKGDLARAADQAFARVEALLLRVLAGERSPVPPRPERPAARYSRRRALEAAARRLAGRLLSRFRKSSGRHGHWNIALRRETGAANLSRFDLGDWRPLPIDPEIFYADPFVFEEEGQAWLFAEACAYATGKGVIVRAPLGAEGEAGPFRTVLEQPWHLSYPFVFRDGGEIWLVPESAAKGGIELHRATDFPDQWVLEQRLFEDLRLVDATFFEHDGRLWLFAGRIGDNGGSSWDELYAWHAPGIRGPWEPHRLNPIKSDCRGARPGGRPLRRDGHLFRPAQICERFYGEALVWFEIVTLTPDAFAEVEVATWRATGAGRSGPHSADLASPIGAVDFRRDLG
ncbi:MAG TPA: hypothetical protein VEX35_02975 [Allosphingosinicella sp.]|nr:hypothetical protein [Allosphingosinicella sp.]